MLMLRIANYLSGIVRVKISGAVPERFINLCLARGIILWGITKHNDNIFAYLRLPDFFRIRPLARSSRTHIEVAGYRGFPFAVRRIKRRKMLLVGAIMFFILLHTLTSYVWFVDITGQNQLGGEQLKAIVSQSGLRPGVKKDSVNIRAVENAILLSLPEVSWVGVNLTGTRATVEIVEKTAPKQEDKSPANIIALKDGVITEIIAISGQAAVKKGDTVKRGDMLIKGAIEETVVQLSDQLPPAAPSVKLVRAKGIAKAQVWYEGYGEAGITEEYCQRTGRRSHKVSFGIAGHQLSFNQPGAKFERFETEVTHKKLSFWRNSDFTVESTIDVLHELVINTREITPEEARSAAAAKALQAVRNKVPENAQLLVQNIEELKTAETGIIRVKAVVETIEDIGQVTNITQ